MAGNPARGNQVADADITVTQGTSPADNIFAIAIQFKGVNGQDLTSACVVPFYFSTDSTAQALAVDSTDMTDIAIGTDGTILWEDVTDIAGHLVCEADGDADINVTVASGKTVYLNLVMPDGTIITSDACAYT